MMEKNISDFIHKVDNMTDDQLKDMASKRAAKAILTPSERAGMARSKIPEQIAHLLTRIYQGEVSRRKDESVPNSMNDKVFRELESFCQENSTTLVPFDVMANVHTTNVPPQMILDKASYENRGYANMLNSLVKAGPEVAGQILETLAMQLFETQKILNLFGWSIDDLKFMARAKIDAQAKAKKK